MKASDIMCRDVACITLSASANDAARIMWECDCGIVPVVQSSHARRLVGVITDRDICMAAYTQGKTLPEISVESAMARDVLTCRPEDPIARLEQWMREAKIRRLPVVDDANSLIGIVSLADIARQADRHKTGREKLDPREVGDTLAQITRPHSVHAAA